MSDTNAGTQLVLGNVSFSDMLESIDSKLAFVESLCCRIVVQTNSIERNTVKSYHWVTVVIVLFVAYLVGVKYPSFGASALGKVGL